MPAERDHVLCPDFAPAAKGSQCERCFVAAAVDGFVVADERWERPEQAEAICRSDASRHAYPHGLSEATVVQESLF